MRKYYSVPLLFFVLAAAIGLFLRWQFISPTPGIRYTFFLHAHSHVMFLGWIFNVLFLAYVDHHLAGKKPKLFRNFFILLQVLVVAMMISFPIQGYGLYSIIFSTVHTLAVIVFIILFFRLTRGPQSTSLWFARISLLFFFVSTAGPFSLGYLMANGLGNSVWYNFSIYYYLHFQYNGFFLFGIFSLYFQLLERRQLPFDPAAALSFGKWMAAACVPAYVLSILYAAPGLFFNVTGAIAAVIQLAALGRLISEVWRTRKILRADFHPLACGLFGIVLASLILKSLLQTASAHPQLATMAYALRPVVIAYLHLVLLGVITLFLLAWYVEMKFVKLQPARTAIIIILAGFIGSEICLVLMPWWSTVAGTSVSPSLAVFSVSVLLLLGSCLFYRAYVLNKADKNQFYR
ncbi:MAG: hypothetical protein WA874_21275 [Chryseosolibacter sp.]